MNDQITPCWIYRCSKQDEMYLYLAEEGAFDDLPEPLKKAVGRLELAMQLDLTPERTLARVDVTEVIAGLKDQGFFLQMPPKVHAELHDGDQGF